MTAVSIFEALPPTEPDPILGLTEKFTKDTNPKKVNLGAGVYQNEEGRTVFLKVVHAAQKTVVEQERAATYLPIDGNPSFIANVKSLVFGAESPVVKEGRTVVAQTPGGTGALRVVCDFLKTDVGVKTLAVSNPTWVNHPKIAHAAGLAVSEYPYLASDGFSLDFSAMKAALQKLPAHTAVLLHACCHNPTGVDLDENQWLELAEIFEKQSIIPFFDLAYQGFGRGIDEDAFPLRNFALRGIEYVAAYSFSKNFSMYGERMGALIVVTDGAESSESVAANIKGVVRANYSNPPTFGSRVISCVLEDPALREQWKDEVASMRSRIKLMRAALVEGLAERGIDKHFILGQNGMFSFTGLRPEHVERLAREFSIYLVRSGRISVSSLNTSNIQYVCDSIAAVVK